jgi:transcriptional regulator
MEIGSIESLTEHTSLTQLEAQTVVLYSEGESIEGIASQLDEPREVVDRALKQAQTKAEAADSLLTLLPSRFRY